jgi:acetoin utilization deacetylase AcuC-like enzyme
MKTNKHPIIYHSSYDLPLPERHRFPGTKYSLLLKYLEDIGLIQSFLKYMPKPCTAENLSIAHKASYIEAIQTGNLSKENQVRLGLPWSEALRQRSFTAPNGTLLAAQLALKTGIACHAAGGTHHAHWDFGAGFCVFNDLAYTARALIKMGLARRVLILDCDVHQGDGTANILFNDSNILTCSIHCAENYPAKKAVSDLDFPILRGAGDDDYLAVLGRCLSQIDQSNFTPDFVLYDAAIDVHRNDRLGLLEMTSEGICERDKVVLSHFKKKQVPMATTIGGGYGEVHQEVAQRHSIIFRAVDSVFAR